MEDSGRGLPCTSMQAASFVYVHHLDACRKCSGKFLQLSNGLLTALSPCQDAGGAKSDLKAAMRALEISTASKSDTIAAYRAQLADHPEQQAVDRLEQQIQALREVHSTRPSCLT